MSEPRIETPSRREAAVSAMHGLVNGPSAMTLGTSLFVQLLVLVSGVVAARALGAEDRGHLALYWLVPTSLALIGGLGLPQAATYYAAKDLSNAGAVARTSGKAAILISLVLVIFYWALLVAVLKPTGDAKAAAISAFIIPAVFSQSVGLGILQGQQRFRPFNISRTVPPALYAAVITALFVLGEGFLLPIVAAVVASWTIGSFLTWIIAFQDLPLSSRAEPVHISELLKFGIRGVFGSVSPVDDLRVDQLLVGFAVDAKALGFYVAAIAFCNLPRFIAQSIGLVSYPRIASAGSKQEAWSILTRSFKIGIVLITGTVLALIVFVPFGIPFFFGSEFDEAIGLAQILLVGTLFLSIRRLLTEYSRGLGHPGYGSLGELISLGTLIPLSWLLIPPLAEEGVAIAVLISSVISPLVLGGLLLRLRPNKKKLSASSAE